MTYAKHLASTWSRYEKRHPNWEENLASQPVEEPFLYTVPCTKCGGFGKDTCYSNCFVCESCKAAPHIANFFAAVAAVAEQRIAAKKAAAEAKKQAALSIIGRAAFKATGATLFGVEDRRGKEPVVMHLTFIAGKVRGCVNAATGEECKGRQWSGHCCHEDRVMHYESEREAALPVAVRDFEGYTAHLDCGDHREVVRVCDLPALFPCGYRMIEQDDPEYGAWMERLHALPVCAGGDAAFSVQMCLPERTFDIVTEDDMAAHVQDSIRSGEFADPTSCRYCGALCKGGVCMDCLGIAA